MESTRTIRYDPVDLEVNMRFIRFLIGGFLIVGSIILACFLLFGIGFAAMTGTWSYLIIWAVIDLIAFMGGLWLVSKNRP